MRTTMTWVGFDVHARSTHGAAIDTLTGELSRMRFGPGIEAPLAWLAGLPGPVQACYEAGPTGFGLYRSAVAAGVAMPVIAPGKTPRGPSDRVKTDRKDAELLARLLLAGSLTTVVVPAPEVEAAREMTRAHDACRRDLMNARHRVSKMLLRHGRVYPKSTTWTAEHRRWLSRQQFSEPASEVVFAEASRRRRRADLAQAGNRFAAVAVGHRRAVVADRRTAEGVPRDRHVDGVLAASRARRRLDALCAGDVAVVLARADPVAEPVRRVLPSGPDHQDRLDPRPPATRRVGLALQPPAAPGRDAGQPPGRAARPRTRDRKPRPATTAQAQPHDARPRQAAQRHRRRLRARAVLLPLGRRHRRLTPGHSLTGPEAGAPGHPRPARATQL